ncbi:MAG: acetylxylan esterase [Actinomycetota bacterium]|nr:acetylxylan esterase [Actinomycetota bacterium]
MLVDLSYEELIKYKPVQNKENDFDEFWAETLNEAKSEDLKPNVEKIDYIVKEIDAFKAYYNGYGGARICGWYLLPKFFKPPFPVLLWFHGYGDNKQKINYYLKWLLMGYAVFAIDIRGQNGESMDNNSYPSPSAVGYMTKGVFDKNKYYYRYVYADCIRALDFLASRKEIDMSRICITGASQGGGLTLATAALDERPKLAIAEIPYLCHYRRAVEWAEDFPNITYIEFQNVIKKYPEREEEMFKTLSYFDNLNLADKIKSRTIISCAMKDTCCPPSTIFAVYNHIEAEKQMIKMPYYVHSWETGINFDENKVELVKKHL